VGGFSFWYNSIMATSVYQTKIIHTIDMKPIEISPLKIKFLRKFMDIYPDIVKLRDDEEIIGLLCRCTLIAMEQYSPNTFSSIEDIEDSFDLDTIKDIISYASGSDEKEDEKDKNEKNDGAAWDKLDLVSLEAEVFTLGIWKNFEELENSLSISELITLLTTKREKDYQDKKFLAAIQGVDLDKQSGQSRGQKEWEDLKARVFSKGQAKDSNDVLALQGINAQQAGFGIGMGLDYEDLRQTK
jgi:hypothetical protein